METKPGTPEPGTEQQHSDDDELEDLEAPAESQEEVAGGGEPSCPRISNCGETQAPN